MREIPLLATDAVAQRILSGAQTQDRRSLFMRWASLPKRTPVPTEWSLYVDGGGVIRDASGDVIKVGPAVGDAHWIREAHAFCPKSPLMERWSHTPAEARVLYRADGDVTLSGPRGIWSVKWKPSIHMPRWACRIRKPIVRVWVERVQEISEEGALAEGMRAWEEHWWTGSDAGTDSYPEMLLGPGDAPPEWMENPRLRVEKRSARESFRVLWNSLYPGSWERNDWVSGVEWTHGNEVKHG